MLEWTGERFLPWIKESTIAYEHLHRYAYAAALVKDKRVLDLASGEGYGSKMLSETAASVVGVDIDENAVRHAAEKYGGTTLQYLAGSITEVPIRDDRSFDVIVCFEAIEHIEDQVRLLSEVKRLLKPDGIFIVSTPNKAIYHDESPEENPFHVKELYFEEFEQLLARYFKSIRFLGQRIHPGSSIWPIAATHTNAAATAAATPGSGFHEFVIERGESDFEFIDSGKRVPLYFIAVASDSASSLQQPGSVLLDQSDSLLEEKNREIRASAEETKWREQQVAERETTIASLEEAVKWREVQIHDRESQIQDQEKQIHGFQEALQWSETRAKELEKSIASQNEALAWRAGQVAELEKARDFWVQESASLNQSLQNTQRQLSLTTDTLASIYASRGWKFIMKLRRIRDTLTGRGKAPAK